MTPPAVLPSPTTLSVAKPKADSLRWTGWLLGLALLGLLGYLQRDRFLPGQNDFVQLYAGARLSGTPALYEPAASQAIHKEVLGFALQSVYYSRPPFYAFVLRPFGMLPYPAAYWLFQALSLAALIAILRIWSPRCRELIVFTSMCLPVLSNILTGQDLAFALLAIVLAIEAMRRGSDFVAGLLLSLCAIKIHLFLLIPVVLLIHRKWHVLAGGAAGGSALAAISFLSDGWDWPRRYLALLSNPDLHPGPEHMPTLRGLIYTVTGGESQTLLIVGSLLVLAIVVAIARRSNLEYSLGLAMAGGLLTGYHAYLQDGVVLLLTFVLVLQHSEWPPLRAAVALILTPPVFLFLANGRPWNVVVPLALFAVLILGLLKPVNRRAPLQTNPA